MTPDGPVDMATELNVEKDFSIDPDNLDGELCRIGQLLCEYGDIYAELKANLARVETQKERVYNYYALWYRDPENFPGKPTEGKIAELVKSTDGYTEVTDKLNNVKLNYAKIENFFKSLNQKADVLKTLCYKNSAELRHTIN